MNPTSERIRARYRIGVDVGGTHTDIVLADTETGTFRIEKLPSTPVNPDRAVLEGLGRFIAAGLAPQEIDFFSHGTTVTTNALLEMNGAQIGAPRQCRHARHSRSADAGTRRRQPVRPFLQKTTASRAPAFRARNRRAARLSRP